MTGIAFVLLGVLMAMSLVLLGRYTLLILGVFLPLLPLTVPSHVDVPNGLLPMLFGMGALCLYAARPSWLRRGHKDRITRSVA